MDIFSENVDPTRDTPKVRSIPTANGNKYNIKQEDPHGFFRIHMEKGQVPEELRGAYTRYEFAAKAVQTYLNKKK